jgi:hypothetical protein
MITCCIRYTLDPHRIDDFERYATTWTPIIARCGGELLGDSYHNMVPTTSRWP